MIKMKCLLIFIMSLPLFTTQALKADEIKYGLYETKCHWTSCTQLIIQKDTIRRIHKSDKLLYNSDTLDRYTFKNNILETETSKDKYYYFSSPTSEKNNCNHYLIPEKPYNFCNSKEECILKYSLCFVAKSTANAEVIYSTPRPLNINTSKDINKAKASIIMSTCPKNAADALNKGTIKVNIWVQENGLTKDIQISKSTGSDETDNKIILDLMQCKYNPAKEKNGTKVASWIQL